jgi:hypothetical protein
MKGRAARRKILGQQSDLNERALGTPAVDRTRSTISRQCAVIRETPDIFRDLSDIFGSCPMSNACIETAAA